ncbi:hypothetical protein DPMN_077127 [Dreissena polymorpha]|uniref:Uncharacterized protein n=1 Tax=Dreissena polymorpha TaxID=45954 RepID=A0A9D4BP22_DREPO|nr:hypothetical protein DPMN_077127 [Dreissena polymorpha]
MEVKDNAKDHVHHILFISQSQTFCENLGFISQNASGFQESVERTPGRKRSAGASDSNGTVITSKKVRSGGDSPVNITTDRMADAR